MKRILIVDDSPTIRRMMIAALKNLTGVEFDEAGNGLEAIERLTLASINLIFLDLNMPDIHGIEVIEFVRGHHAFKHIPICVVTTRADLTSRTQALEAGANVYLTKPFSPPDIIAQAENLLTDK